jgi:acyl-coenzyme A thioesterase PaaI-like protein
MGLLRYLKKGTRTVQALVLHSASREAKLEGRSRNEEERELIVVGELKEAGRPGIVVESRRLGT